MTISAPAAGTDQGPRRGRLGYVIIGIFVAVCAGGWAFVMANAGQTPGIAAQTITYDVRGDSEVEIKWQVGKPKGDRVRCVIDAVDADFAQVGRLEVIVPAGRSRLERTDVLRTSKRANAARVKECRTV